MRFDLRPRWRPSPATRVAFGLVGLMVTLLLLADLLVGGFLPDRSAEIRRHRLTTAELTAAQVAQALGLAADADLQPLLRAALHAEPELRSIAVLDGQALRAVAGDHEHQWKSAATDMSSIDNLRVQLLTNGQPHGEVQLAFTPAGPTSLGQWLREPLVAGLLVCVGLGFLGFQLYLRRAMRYLDPSSAVPERVRTAFDTLTEGVLVLDTGARVMLANKVLTGWAPSTAARLTGLRADHIEWLVAALPGHRPAPWREVLTNNRPLVGIELHLDTGERRRDLVMNCSPINDGFQRARGCLVTFSDVTELHERTENLRVALTDLHASREEIRSKNEELTLLATRDGLTGCLNRRAFMAESQARLAAGGTASCIMCDVDHFKSINDRFGHAGGDEVLKAVVKALGRGLRNGDLLGRYGGEEFCVLLPATTLPQALEVAERLRAEVEARVGASVRHLAQATVTMSFGVEQATAADHPAGFDALVDRADQALYHSKKTGRNRVTAWPALATLPDAATQQPAATVPAA